MNNKKTFSKIKFVTLFPTIENIHLIKDVGMIPYSMNKYFGLNGGIVLYKNSNYEYINKDVKNLEKEYFPFKKFNSLFNCLFYLIKNAKKIDVLHLFHVYQKSTTLCIFIYFLINKKGLIYIHLDSNLSVEKNDVIEIEGKSIKKTIKRFILKKIIFTKKHRKRILFGIQNKRGKDILKKQFPFENVEFITNGYEDTSKSVESKIEKEKIILFVGRVGDKIKRTDILLEGYRKAFPNINDWKLKIVGPIEDEFKEYIEEFKNKYPEIFKNIEFTGPIYDRYKLKCEYMKAKVFCLTSMSESFGLVLVEALANGCTIVSSQIDAAREIINVDEYGSLFKIGDSNDLSIKLIETCNNKKLLLHSQTKGNEYISINYSYKNTLKPLYNWIDKNINK